MSKPKILVTTTSYQDTPGPHHDVLANSGFEIVKARGPLTEQQLLDLFQQHDGFDGLLNGDDAITAKFIDAAMPKLKVIGKYGIGLDSIDVEHATKKKLPVLFTPGVNHTSVSEHAFGLMLSLAKAIPFHVSETKTGKWTRKTGTELYQKTVGIVGLGRVGKEVIKRAVAFDMKPLAYTRTPDKDFCKKYNVKECGTIADLFKQAEIIVLCLPLTEQTRGLVNKDSIATMKDQTMIVNIGRGGVVVEADVIAACTSGKLLGYATDVMEQEPMDPNNAFTKVPNIIITPHIASRTFESVERQAMKSTTNLINFFAGNGDYEQANRF